MNRTRNYHSVFLLFLTISPLLIGGLFTINFIYTEDHEQLDDNTPIKLAAITNVTIQTNMPKLIWIQIQLKVVIISNITGTLLFRLVNPGSELSFDDANVTQLITNNGVELPLEIRTHPALFTLPGIYNLALIVTHIESAEQYTESFEIVLGLGYTVLISLFIIFGTAVLVVLTRKQELDEIKIITAQTTQRVGRVPEGKIPCPTCHSVIDEGLAFCPECGERIPEFLRFTPGSSS